MGEVAERVRVPVPVTETRGGEEPGDWVTVDVPLPPWEEELLRQQAAKKVREDPAE